MINFNKVSPVNLDDIIVTRLKRIPTTGGDVLHALKKNDVGFNGFGEAYFSWIDYGLIKAWKCHQSMCLNLVVPVGMVRLVFHLLDNPDEFRTVEIGEQNYNRVTVPPRIWFGFQGLNKSRNMLMNISDIVHDPCEVKSCQIESFSYVWDI
jgi:dTDP-4-dehydrorhamnose 3,5-epimerase